MQSNYTLVLLCTIFSIHYTFATALPVKNQSNDPEDTLKSVNLERRWYLPHFIPIQYAGNIGFISAGIGYGARKDNYQLSLLYGYAPESIAGVRVHTLTAKNTFSIYQLPLDDRNTLIPYAGLGLSIEVGGRSFLTLPSTMPRSYYDVPKSVHFIVSGGVKVRCTTEQIEFLRGIDFFTELTTIDAYIWYKFTSDEIKLHQIMSLSFGVNLLRR